MKNNCLFLKEMSVVVISDIVKCQYNNVFIGKKLKTNMMHIPIPVLCL
jgi:hypothetical protein